MSYGIGELAIYFIIRTTMIILFARFYNFPGICVNGKNI